MSAAVALGALDRTRRERRMRAASTTGILTAVGVALAITALAVGSVAIAPADVIGALAGTADGGAQFIVRELRLPRLTLALVVGAALGMAGALLQSVVRNPLASPDIVGVTGGASAAAVLAIGAGATGLAVTGSALVGAAAAIVLVLAASVAAAAAAIPLVYLVVRSGETGAATIIQTLTRGRVLEYAANSLTLALATTAAALVLGTAVAVVVTRIRVPFPRTWLLISALPLAVPSYLAGYGWLVSIPSLSGFLPSWLLLTAVTVPYVTLPVAAALRSATGDLEGVARSLGRGPLGAFFVATWPQVRPAAIAGSLLVALYSLSEFGLVAMLRYPTLTWGINSAYSASFDRAQAATLALLLVVLALIVVAGERGARRQLPRQAARAVRPRPVNRGMLVALLQALVDPDTPPIPD